MGLIPNAGKKKRVAVWLRADVSPRTRNFLRCAISLVFIALVLTVAYLVATYAFPLFPYRDSIPDFAAVVLMLGGVLPVVWPGLLKMEEDKPWLRWTILILCVVLGFGWIIENRHDRQEVFKEDVFRDIDIPAPTASQRNGSITLTMKYKGAAEIDSYRMDCDSSVFWGNDKMPLNKSSNVFTRHAQLSGDFGPCAIAGPTDAKLVALNCIDIAVHAYYTLARFPGEEKAKNIRFVTHKEGSELNWYEEPPESDSRCLQEQYTNATQPPVQLPQPKEKVVSFPYVVGSFWATAPVEEWFMMIRHYGPEPVNNIELVFVDENIRKAQSKKPPSGDGTINVDEWQKILHVDELDPSETYYAKLFPWKTINPDDENYTVVITSRQGSFLETLHIAKKDDKWFYAMKVTNRTGDHVFVNCSDPGMEGPSGLPKCFPDYTTKHLGN